MGWKPPQFPTEDHPDWNPDDPYADPVALLEHRELMVRQKFVRQEKAKVQPCSPAAAHAPLPLSVHSPAAAQ
jgi:hypothetical protein